MTSGDEIRYEIRAVTASDEAHLLELARYLDSVNLPHDPAAMAPIIRASDASFSGEIGDVRRREYVFVLYDLHEERAVGTSMILGQLGRRDAPYVYFDVSTEERYSSTLDKHFIHTVLEMGYSYNGPTEIGGLVMHPDLRRSTERLGMQISYVRFLWLAMHRPDFQDTILAELMPPLEPDGRSLLWEAVGRRFTGLSYREADRLSSRNKEFVRGLFPDGPLYATLLPEGAQALIGKVGPQTRGVEKLLTRIGFRYAHRVDPFDGGPHFTAPIDEITLIERVRRVTARAGKSFEGKKRALLGVEYDGPPWFRAVATPFTLSGTRVHVPKAVLEHLAPPSHAWLLPLD